MQTNFPSRAANANSKLVTVTVASEVLSPINSFRESFIISNVGTVPVYINYQPECDTVLYVCRLLPDAILSDDFAGVISVCTDTDTGYVVLTEKV
jgi:hypothetical protein